MRQRAFAIATLALLLSPISLALIPNPVRAQDGATPKSEDRIELLLKELGDEDFEVREAATAALIKEGRSIAARVQKLYAETTDPEIKNRARFILNKLDALPAAPKSTEERPREGLDGPELPPGVQPGMPQDLNELFRGLQLPKGMEKMFEEMQKELQKSLEDMMNPGDKDSREGTRKRVRVWTFPPQPGAPGPGERSPEKAPGEDEAGPGGLRPRVMGLRHPTGLVARPVSPELRTHLKLKLGEGGVLVTQVHKDSWGERAGLAVHDILMSVEGQPISSLDDLDALLEKEGKVEVIRRGERSVMTLPARPPMGREAGKPKDF